jgi:hypothetical protein
MAKFIDIHSGFFGVSAEHLRAAHERDLVGRSSRMATTSRSQRRAVVLVAMTLVALVVAAPAAAAQIKLDRAWGSGTRAPVDANSTPPTFEFNASSNADGTAPTGSFIFKTLLSAFTGSVECLDVHGGTATLVGHIATATGGFDGYQGTLYVTVVQDNGVATKRHPSPDLMSATTFGITNTTVAALCADPTSFTGTTMFPLVSGDVTVIDR